MCNPAAMNYSQFPFSPFKVERGAPRGQVREKAFLGFLASLAQSHLKRRRSRCQSHGHTIPEADINISSESVTMRMGVAHHESIISPKTVLQRCLRLSSDSVGQSWTQLVSHMCNRVIKQPAPPNTFTKLTWQEWCQTSSWFK